MAKKRNTKPKRVILPITRNIFKVNECLYIHNNV